MIFGGPVDPYFRLSLLLQTRTAGELLWAYNLRHVDVLERFVRATLRERAVFTDGMATMTERLPRWIKSSSNRTAVLRGLTRLRTIAAEPSA